MITIMNNYCINLSLIIILLASEQKVIMRSMLICAYHIYLFTSQSHVHCIRQKTEFSQFMSAAFTWDTDLIFLRLNSGTVDTRSSKQSIFPAVGSALVVPTLCGHTFNWKSLHFKSNVTK